MVPSVKTRSLSSRLVEVALLGVGKRSLGERQVTRRCGNAPARLVSILITPPSSSPRRHVRTFNTPNLSHLLRRRQRMHWNALCACALRRGLFPGQSSPATTTTTTTTDKYFLIHQADKSDSPPPWFLLSDFVSRFLRRLV